MAALPSAAVVVDASKHKTVKGKTLAFAHFQKTRMCTYMKGGDCVYGANCFFAHDESEIQTPVSLKKTSLCKAFMTGTCPHKASACKFAHGKRELRRVMPGEEVPPVPQAPQVDTKQRRCRKKPANTKCDERELYQASTTDSLPPVDHVSSYAPSESDVTTLWESESSHDGYAPEVVAAPKTNQSDGVLTTVVRGEVIPPVVVREEAIPPVQKVGSMALPAFVWQGRVFLGNIEEVLLQAQPECYED